MSKEKCLCEACVRKRDKYKGDPAKRALVLATAKARRDANKMYWVKKLGGKCVDCGLSDIRVLSFDHNGGRKERSMSELLNSKDPERPELVLEAGRCKLRCLNCHAIKTNEHGDFKPERDWS